MLEELGRNANIFTQKNIIKVVWLVILLALSSFLIFYNAFRFNMPLAYAGLYTLMSEQVAINNFALPFSVPYYGPGGIPFAYPPLAFYLMAIFIKLDVSVITYLRFIPPIFSLLSLVPLYLLVNKLSNSHIAAGMSVLYAASSPSLYVMHTWAAGSVRAIAFFFMLFGFYFSIRALHEKNFRFGAIAGIFFGLTLLTHLFYALFFMLWLASWFFIYVNRLFTWKMIASTFIVAAILVSPWLLMMISRYGEDIFINTFSSHDNSTFIAILLDPKLLPNWFFGKFAILMSLPFVFIIVGIGLVHFLFNRKFGIPLLLFLSAMMLSGEGDRFVALLGSILFGVGILVLSKWYMPNKGLLGLGLLGFIGVVIFQMINAGFQEIKTSNPSLRQNAFDVARYVQENTPLHSRYLFVTGQSEAEWFPYILKREPLVSKWGSEWLGTYYEQSSLQAAVALCRDEQSVECLKQLEFHFEPSDILITRKSERRLTSELETLAGCGTLATFERYIIWETQCLSQE
jgi:hypothetical protein